MRGQVKTSSISFVLKILRSASKALYLKSATHEFAHSPLQKKEKKKRCILITDTEPIFVERVSLQIMIIIIIAPSIFCSNGSNVHLNLEKKKEKKTKNSSVPDSLVALLYTDRMGIIIIAMLKFHGK